MSAIKTGGKKKQLIRLDDEDEITDRFGVKKEEILDYIDGSVPYQANKKLDFNKDTWYTYKSSDGELDYVPGRRTNIKQWGQLKLFLSELQFILYFLNEKVKHIIYVGAAPGHHTYVLALMFPDITFHLYDMRDVFDKRLKTMKNVKTHYDPEGFTDKHIAEWKKKRSKFAFMSDIRDLEYGNIKTEKDILSDANSIVKEDLDLQKYWVEQLKPYISMLKFRGMWEYNSDTVFKYFDGIILRQVFNGQASGETRLVVFDYKKMKEWSNRTLEIKTVYHNNIIRAKQKFNTVTFNRLKIGDDFDSAFFVTLARDYLKSINIEDNETNLEIIIEYILINIHEEVGNKLLTL